MAIEIFLGRYWGDELRPADIAELENLENAIRDLLLSKGFNRFAIENKYTGNRITMKNELDIG